MVIPYGYELVEEGEFFVLLRTSRVTTVGEMDLLIKNGLQFVRSDFCGDFTWYVGCMKIATPCGS